MPTLRVHPSVTWTLLTLLLTQISPNPYPRPAQGQLVGNFETCSLEDFTFHYTECDGRGERWRYALPKNHRLHCLNTPPPVSGLNCCRCSLTGLLTADSPNVV